MHATQHSAVLALIGLFAATLTISNRAAAAQANPGETCCGIVSINANGLVSARQADGRVFQFQVTDKTLLASLHIGQPVWADFAAKQVTLKYGGSPCCEILGARPFGPVDGARPFGPVDGAKQLQPAGGAPCCDITAIDRGAGTATATVKATGEAFTFTVGDKAVLASLRTGQPVWADFAAKQVTLKYGATPCCPIAARPVGPVDGARPVGPVDGARPVGPEDGDDRHKVRPPARPLPDGARPVGPVDGARPIGPVDGARPIGPVDGARPVGPVDAARPATPCCNVVANAALTGRLGRLVVAFPEGANPGSSRVDVFKAGETGSLQTGYGAQSLDLLPGTYSVVISGARVEGVSIQSGHDTRLRVGILRINAGASTRADVLAADGKTALTNGYGAQVIGLPVGTYRVQIAGGLEAVTIQDGKITEF